jgi:phosphoribosylformylglycinamidine cyclo-ligase
MDADIQLSSWRFPDIFNWLQHEGTISLADMLITFNCGIGMIAVVAAKDAFMVRDALEKAGEAVHIIGELVETAEGTPRVTYSDSLCVA